MSKQGKLIVAAVILGVCIGSVAKAADEINSQPPLGVEVKLDYVSKYIWRGQNLNDRSAFQPYVSLSKYGFTGSIWATQDWTNVNGHSGNFTQINSTLDYTNAFPGVDGLNWSVGVIDYDFPHTRTANTVEIYGGLTFTALPLSPSIKVYRDVDEIKGAYYQLGIGKTIERAITWNDNYCSDLALGASIAYGNSAYNKGYFHTVNGGGFNDLTLTAALPTPLGKGWVIRPSINYATMLADNVREATNKSDNFWAGIGLSANF
jgi:hypothetical protein